MAQVILAKGFLPSSNSYDWLGDGIYFWQDAPRRAREWAVANHGKEGSVIAATIDLDGCIDLLDIGWRQDLALAYERLSRVARQSEQRLPTNRQGAHRLDRAVMNYFIQLLGEGGVRVRSVRAAFDEGPPIFPGSALTTRSHVQIAVRDLACISGMELVK